MFSKMTSCHPLLNPTLVLMLMLLVVLMVISFLLIIVDSIVCIAWTCGTRTTFLGRQQR